MKKFKEILMEGSKLKVNAKTDIFIEVSQSSLENDVEAQIESGEWLEDEKGKIESSDVEIQTFALIKIKNKKVLADKGKLEKFLEGSL